MRRSSFVPMFLLMLLVTSSASAQFGRRKVPQAVRPDKELTQRWQVGATIQAVGGPCWGLIGTASVPTEWPEQQVRIVDEDVSQYVDRVNYRNTSDVRQMVFSIRQLPAGQTANVLITFEVTKNSVLAPNNPERFVIPKNAPREVRIYLAASPQIDVRHSSIRSKVKELVNDDHTAWQQVEAIYDWVRDNVKYQNGQDKGAVAALRDNTGNKHDLTSLFIALCRAHKVPARTVWVPDHCYPEFYLMDEQGKGHWFPCQVAGTRDFGSMPDHRPILQKGENIKVPENPTPQRFVAEFLTGRGNGQPQAKFVRKLLPAN